MKTKTSIILTVAAATALTLGAGCRKGGDPGVGAGGATTQNTESQAQPGNTSGSGSAPNATDPNSGAAGPGVAGASTDNDAANASSTAGTDSAGRPAGSAGGNTEKETVAE